MRLCLIATAKVASIALLATAAQAQETEKGCEIFWGSGFFMAEPSVEYSMFERYGLANTGKNIKNPIAYLGTVNKILDPSPEIKNYLCGPPFESCAPDEQDEGGEKT